MIFPARAATVTHTVRTGERLSDIAKRYKVTVKAIVDKNKIAVPDSIRPGQRLLVPVPDMEGRTVEEIRAQVVPAGLQPLPPVSLPVLVPPLPQEREPGLSDAASRIQVEVIAAQGPVPPLRERSTRTVARRTLTVGESLILDFHDISRVAIGNPAVADVAVVSVNQLLVNGKSQGLTELYVWDSRSRPTYHTYHLIVRSALDLNEVARQIERDLENPDIRVRVVGDTILLEGEVSSQIEFQRAEAIAQAHHKTVKSLIEVKVPPAPTPVPPPPPAPIEASRLQDAIAIEGIRVRPLTDTAVAVEGTVSPQEAERAQKIIAAWGKDVQILNLLETAQPVKKQIMVRARVVDINKSRLKNLGVDWGRVRTQAGTVSGTAGATIQDQPFLFGQSQLGPYDKFFGGGPVQRFDPIGARLTALIQENQARVLSEPNLIVMDGEKADILVGGSIPIPVIQPGGGGGGLAGITIQYQDYGVKLQIEPRVEADGRIHLKVSPEVSSLDYANAVTISGFSIPALRTRKASSVVTVGDGQTLVIGGLLQNDISKAVKRIPLLSKIPVLGELFKSTSFTKGESELVILVTPEILKTEG